MDKKTLIIGIFIIIISILGIVRIKTFIDTEIAKQNQSMQELKAKEIADFRLKCETEKLQQEEELKKKNTELVYELEKAKILIEKLKKQGQYSTMIKTDLNGFMKELDSVLGVKGKQKDEK